MTFPFWIILILAFAPVFASGQMTRTAWEKDMERRQNIFEKSAPKYDIGRALFPGLLGFVGGSMNTDTERGRIVQQGLFFGCGVSTGIWKEDKTKDTWIRVGCAVFGAALGFTVKNATR